MPTRQRRRRRRGPVEPEGQRKSKLPFPVNLIFNVKSFYVVFIIVMIASMAAVGLGVSQGKPNIVKPSPIDITATPNATSQAKIFASPAQVIDGTKPYVATIKTNKGDITITLATDTKETVNSFYFLATKGFYNGQAFFYLDHTYWAQVGDPACNPDLQQVCTGTGDSGYRVPLEAGSLKHTKWAVVAPSVQGAADNVSGGQFRILFEDDQRLDGTETVFGTVTGGQDVLENAPTLHLCTALTQEESGCATDFSNALIIQDVELKPAS